jgi:hypothetical protein
MRHLVCAAAMVLLHGCSSQSQGVDTGTDASVDTGGGLDQGPSDVAPPDSEPDMVLPDVGAGDPLTDLLLHYRMNAIISGLVLDATKNANHGRIYPTAPGTLPFAADARGKAAEALVFAGSTTCVKTYSTVIPASGDFTVSAWVWLENVSGERTVLSQAPSASHFGLGMLANGNVSVGQDWADTGVAFPSKGAWHHLAVTKTSSGKTLYLDGAFAATSSGATQNPGAGAFGVGCQLSTGDQHWDGKIDDVRVYSVALDVGEIDELHDIGTHPEQKGLLAHYKLDDNAADSIVKDSAEETYDAIYRQDGTSARQTNLLSNTDRFGSLKSAFELDGASDCLEVQDGIDLSKQDDFSIAVWALLKDSKTTGFRRILSQGLLTDYFSPGIHANNTISVGYSWKDTGVPYPSRDKWHHFVVTRSANPPATRLYVDGKLRKSINVAHVPPTTGTLRIGCQFGTWGEYWNGKIDDLRIFGSALDDDQVKSLWRGMELNMVGRTDKSSKNAGAPGVDYPLLPVMKMPKPQSCGPDRYNDGTNKCIVHDGVSSYYKPTPHQLTKLNRVMTSSKGTWNNFTLTAWINTDPAATGKRWIVRAGSKQAGSRHVGLAIDATSTLHAYVQTAGGVDSLYVDPYGRAGQWAHVALTYDGNDTKLYLDGALASQSTTLTASGPLGELPSFGVSPDGDYRGGVDDVHLYGRTLDENEVRADMLNDFGADRVFTYFFAGTGAPLKSWKFPYWSNYPSTVEMITQLHNGYTGVLSDRFGGSDGIAYGEDSKIWCRAQPCDNVGFGGCFRKWITVNDEFGTALKNELDRLPGRVILNLVGFSRGAVSSIWQAHRLVRGTDSVHKQGSSLTHLRDRIAHVNILAFEPVPAQNPFCLKNEIFYMPSIVKNYIGIYGRDERTGNAGLTVDTRIWIPGVEVPAATKAWHLMLPGAHETIVGNAQLDGHDVFNYPNALPTYAGPEDSFHAPSRSVSYMGGVIAQGAFRRYDWGNTTFKNVYPATYSYASVKLEWNKFSNINSFAHHRTVSFSPSSLVSFFPHLFNGTGCWWMTLGDVALGYQNNARCVVRSEGLSLPPKNYPLSNMFNTVGGLYSLMNATKACETIWQHTRMDWTFKQCSQ